MNREARERGLHTVNLVKRTIAITEIKCALMRKVGFFLNEDCHINYLALIQIKNFEDNIVAYFVIFCYNKTKSIGVVLLPSDTLTMRLLM